VKDNLFDARDFQCRRDIAVSASTEWAARQRRSCPKFEGLGLLDSSFSQRFHEGNWIHRIRQEVDASLGRSFARQ
jgi:hypothetical protein